MIERLQNRLSALKERKNIIINKLDDLKESMNNILAETGIHAESNRVTFYQDEDGDGLCGKLKLNKASFLVELINFDQENYYDLHNYPDYARDYKTKQFSDCDIEWLEKLTSEETLQSLISDIDSQLINLTSKADNAISSINRILNKQVAIVTSEIGKSLEKCINDDLFQQWEKARININIDPKVSITLSSSYLESVCKYILINRNISLPNKQVITNLINECSSSLPFSNDHGEELHIRKIISGIKGIFSGIGELRTNSGVSHGESPGKICIDIPTARWVNQVAGTISLYLLIKHEESM